MCCEAFNNSTALAETCRPVSCVDPETPTEATYLLKAKGKLEKDEMGFQLAVLAHETLHCSVCMRLACV